MLHLRREDGRERVGGWRGLLFPCRFRWTFLDFLQITSKSFLISHSLKLCNLQRKVLFIHCMWLAFFFFKTIEELFIIQMCTILDTFNTIATKTNLIFFFLFFQPTIAHQQKYLHNCHSWFYSGILSYNLSHTLNHSIHSYSSNIYK